MTKTIFIMVVLTLSNEPKVNTVEFDTFKECIMQQYIIESTTQSFAKCVEREERID